MPQIKFENITKTYDDGGTVLENVSFEIDKGEFVFLVGPSGAGKTTLIRLLIKEQEPSEGKILISDFEYLFVPDEDTGKSSKKKEKDKDSEEISLSDRKGELINIFDLPPELLPELRRKIGVVFQDFKVLRSKTVFENVAVALEVVNAPKEEINEVVPNVLGLVGLADKVDRFPRQLSGGELQRLSIARALAHEPDILVADEPTGMIDKDSAREVLNVLEKVNSLGTTILMSTHDYNIVDMLKKRVIRIEDGKVKSDKKEGTYND